MVVAPGYYKSLMTDEVIEQYFIDVANASPIPIVLYNFPGIANGIDLELDLIKRLVSNYSHILQFVNNSKGLRLFFAKLLEM